MAEFDDENSRAVAIKEAFVRERGYWTQFTEGLLEFSPNFLDGYRKFVDSSSTGALSPKMRELVYIAIDASATHLFKPGLKQHVSAAIKMGATTEELIETLQLAAIKGLDSCIIGVPVLVEELTRLGRENEIVPPHPRPSRDVKADGPVGAAPPLNLSSLACLSPAFVQASAEFIEVPWVEGPLEPKDKELILLAISSAMTQLNEHGIRTHVRSALAHGATAAEVAEIFQLVSALGIHSCTVGVPIIMEQLAKTKS